MTEKRPKAAGRRERRVFTPEFKQDAVRLLFERRRSGVSVAQVGRELDVRPDQLRVWVREFAAQDGGLPAVGVVETPAQELARLRRENAILREERAFTKKVAVYFAKESR
jgi:transposase